MTLFHRNTCLLFQEDFDSPERLFHKKLLKEMHLRHFVKGQNEGGVPFRVIFLETENNIENSIENAIANSKG